jgi:glycosyltransferase involved in cell wall biosynthesis
MDGATESRALSRDMSADIGSVRAEGLRLALFTDTYAPQINGVSRTLTRLVDAVHDRGGVAKVFTVDVGNREELEAHASRTDVGAEAHVARRYRSIPFWAYNSLRLAWPAQANVRRELRAFAPTLVHSATEFGVGLAGRWAAQALGVPFVSSYHTSFAAYASYYRLGWLSKGGWSYLRWFHNAGARTYCPSGAIAEEVSSHGFTNAAIWSRGVDTTRFAPHFRSDALRSRLTESPDQLIVAYVGRLAAEKGLTTGLEAVRRASLARPGRIRFVAVGDGPLDAWVRAHAPAGSWIPGVLQGEPLSTAYASADVFLFPSATDTFGNVLLESMASGVPVVAADVGPSRELVATDRGWLVPAHDADAMANVLVQLVDRRDDVQRASVAALSFARSQRWSVIWDHLLADYHAISTTAGRAAPRPSRSAAQPVPSMR